MVVSEGLSISPVAQKVGGRDGRREAAAQRGSDPLALSEGIGVSSVVAARARYEYYSRSRADWRDRNVTLYALAAAFGIGVVWLGTNIKVVKQVPDASPSPVRPRAIRPPRTVASR